MGETTSDKFLRFRQIAGNDLAAALLVLASAFESPENEDAPDRMLTIKGVAMRLGVSSDTVRGIINQGQLAASRVGTGRGAIRVDPDELRRFQKRSAGATR